MNDAHTTDSTATPSAPAASADANAVPTGPMTLCIDVGGTGIKVMVLDDKGNPSSERLREDTPRPATPLAVVGMIRSLVERMPAFDRVSVGFPGVVHDHVIHTAPNLDGDWAQYPLGQKIEELTGKPTRVLNDAGVQGHGVIEGKGLNGAHLRYGHGNGVIYHRVCAQSELAHHPFKKAFRMKSMSATLLSKKLAKSVGKTCRPRFANPADFESRANGRRKRRLPGLNIYPHVKITENIAGLLGGIALWHHGLIFARVH